VGSALLALHMIAAIVIEARDLRAGHADTGLDRIPGA
jgi:hypothetical protein